MSVVSGRAVRDLHTDPFGERRSVHAPLSKQLLGGRFHFQSDSAALLALVEAAYGGLPPHRLPGQIPEFEIELKLLPGRSLRPVHEPPPVRMQAGAGMLCGVINAMNYVAISPAQRQALVVVSQDMLRFPYHLRYELIEFAVFILAARSQGLIPLHGACVGRQGRGVLLLGHSGAGKSTLALHSLLQGLDFLSEDAVLVQPENLLATGVANYLHMKDDALGLVDEDACRWIRYAPVIRRRSGVEKFEADLRNGPGRLAAAPLKLVGAVLLSSQLADHPAQLLRAVPADQIAARLSADQPYAAGQPGWLHFKQKLVDLGVHELRRGACPQDSVDALRQLLA
ncbi:serine kinase [Dyella acidiphila]|uniref:Serine kinase n=1 Tax=Dyella acidiphila TaxID=2775866 RepID=A0ABR9GCX2_9GAMM|nr:serine kinase [Dyella acidiphila]MBE1161887.1 serine kinase [Dyella acidiphila]